jgi:hypothetical protein
MDAREPIESSTNASRSIFLSLLSLSVMPYQTPMLLDVMNQLVGQQSEPGL